MENGEKVTADLKIGGMHCASCALSIEDSVKKIGKGVQVRVNFGTDSAQVVYDPRKVSLPEIEGAIRTAGYEVVNQDVVIRVGGMVCAMCVEAIERALTALPGISSVRVNLATESARVTYNPSLSSVREMRSAIEEAGYQYLGIAGELSPEAEEEARRKDLALQFRRFTIGFAVSLPLMVLMFLPLPVTMHTLSWIMLAVTTPVFFYVAYPIFLAAGAALRNRILSMDVMYAMGTGVAYGSSVLGTLGIILTHDFMFYDTAVMLASFLILGRYLEARAKGRTSEAIRKLIGLTPRTATVVRDGIEVKIAIEEVGIGDVIIVKPGEKVAVDGVVTGGESYVDESMISGEPVPVLKSPGVRVSGGTLNTTGVFSFRADRIGKDTVLARIIRLVEDAQATKPPVQRIADVAVTYFIPAVLVIAFSASAIWYFGLGASLLFSLTVLISVLVVACPCALGLATPTAITVGVGRGAELGILIRNGEVLEVADHLTTVIFDKTGTLTRGKPAVTDIFTFGIDETALLSLAASVEKNSSHPLAEAVVRHAQENNIPPEPSREFTTFGGRGVAAVVRGEDVLIGNRGFLADRNIGISPELEAAVVSFENDAKTAVLVALGGRPVGVIAIADTIKETSPAAVQAVAGMGLAVVMITGDNQRTADAVARQVGIGRVIAEVLPEDKEREVAALQKSGEVVAFVGDGINDAPALARSDVGIAVGSGTDVAIESGDIVLTRDDLLDAAAAIQLSRKVMTRIKQNIFWAFAYNAALIPLAAGLLYPLTGYTFSPELAALAMAASSVTVVSLSLLLKSYIPPAKKRTVEV